MVTWIGIRGPVWASRNAPAWEKLGRDPYLLETSLPGVFAVGDVRSSSVKRVASAVGEGSIPILFASEHLGHRAGLAATGPAGPPSPHTLRSAVRTTARARAPYR